jgi:type II secretory pathway pseudopilin PulG
MLRFGKIKVGNKGDTLIEVLFAVSVFSLIVVGSLSIMNQGSATAERSLEITLVRQQIDSQAETLRYLNSSYITAYSADPTNIPSGSLADQWIQIQKSLVGSVTSLDDTACPTSAPAGSFILNTKTTNDSIRFINVGGLSNGPPNGVYEPATTFSQVRYYADPTNPDYNNIRSDGIWIEAISGTDESDPSQIAQTNQIHADYIDFHIDACWESPGQSNPITIGTIVRLYEPI